MTVTMLRDAHHQDGGALAETAATFDIAYPLDRWPRPLSGGEARRVAWLQQARARSARGEGGGDQG